MLHIRVAGTPAPQGSKRAFAGKRKDGTTFASTVESSYDRVQTWREDVKQAGLEAMRGVTCRQDSPLDGPLVAAMVFWFPRPKGHYGTGRNAGVLKESAPPAPAGMPDLSKLTRSTEDALTSAGVWADDARVVRYIDLSKRYLADGEVPGADIWIWTWGEAPHGIHGYKAASAYAPDSP